MNEFRKLNSRHICTQWKAASGHEWQFCEGLRRTLCWYRKISCCILLLTGFDPWNLWLLSLIIEQMCVFLMLSSRNLIFSCYCEEFLLPLRWLYSLFTLNCVYFGFHINVLCFLGFLFPAYFCVFSGLLGYFIFCCYSALHLIVCLCIFFMLFIFLFLSRFVAFGHLTNLWIRITC